MLTADTTDELAGPAFQQTASATMSGNYVLNDTGADGTNEDELDAVGPVTTGTGTFSGFADLNWLNTGTAWHTDCGPHRVWCILSSFRRCLYRYR